MLIFFACAPEDSAKPLDSGAPTDADGDGYGADDCDDADATVNPGAVEHCDDRDEDCDGATDEEAADAPTWFSDADGDGFGGEEAGAACTAPTGAVAEGGDCDDGEAEVHPGAEERCDGLDNDCDPETDEAGVSLDGVGGYASIQAAIDASAPGATISVCGGSWSENLVVGHDLLLLGGGASVDGGGRGAVLVVEAGRVEVEELDLGGGSGHPTDAGSAGGGAYVAAGASLVLRACSLSGNAADAGGALYGAAIELEEVELLENEATDGGALFVADGGSVRISGGRIGNNQAENVGGGAYLGIGARLDGAAVSWDGNRSEVYAGAIYADEDSVIADEGSLFDNNASDDKGGALYLRYASFTGSDTSFIGGVGTWGGAAMLYGSTLSLSGATVQYNSADLGGAFYVYVDSLLSVDGSVVEGNSAGEGGGGARVRTTSALSSTGSSWGVGDSDNSPDDIDMDEGSFDFVTEDFSCSTETGTCQ